MLNNALPVSGSGSKGRLPSQQQADAAAAAADPNAG